MDDRAGPYRGASPPLAVYPLRNPPATKRRAAIAAFSALVAIASFALLALGVRALPIAVFASCVAVMEGVRAARGRLVGGRGEIRLFADRVEIVGVRRAPVELPVERLETRTSDSRGLVVIGFVPIVWGAGPTLHLETRDAGCAVPIDLFATPDAPRRLEDDLARLARGLPPHGV